MAPRTLMLLADVVRLGHFFLSLLRTRWHIPFLTWLLHALFNSFLLFPLTLFRPTPVR